MPILRQGWPRCRIVSRREVTSFGLTNNRAVQSTCGPRGPTYSRSAIAFPLPIPSGLIHAWIGAGFVPNATIPDILRVVRDYDHYEQVYKPGVIASKRNSEDGPTDRFFLRFANKSVVAKNRARQ